MWLPEDTHHGPLRSARTPETSSQDSHGMRSASSRSSLRPPDVGQRVRTPETVVLHLTAEEAVLQDEAFALPGDYLERFQVVNEAAEMDAQDRAMRDAISNVSRTAVTPPAPTEDVPVSVVEPSPGDVSDDADATVADADQEGSDPSGDPVDGAEASPQSTQTPEVVRPVSRQGQALHKVLRNVLQGKVTAFIRMLRREHFRTNKYQKEILDLKEQLTRQREQLITAETETRFLTEERKKVELPGDREQLRMVYDRSKRDMEHRIEHLTEQNATLEREVFILREQNAALDQNFHILSHREEELQATATQDRFLIYSLHESVVQVRKQYDDLRDAARQQVQFTVRSFSVLQDFFRQHIAETAARSQVQERRSKRAVLIGARSGLDEELLPWWHETGWLRSSLSTIPGGSWNLATLQPIQADPLHSPPRTARPEIEDAPSPKGAQSAAWDRMAAGKSSEPRRLLRRATYGGSAFPIGGGVTPRPRMGSPDGGGGSGRGGGGGGGAGFSKGGSRSPPRAITPASGRGSVGSSPRVEGWRGLSKEVTPRFGFDRVESGASVDSSRGVMHHGRAKSTQRFSQRSSTSYVDDPTAKSMSSPSRAVSTDSRSHTHPRGRSHSPSSRHTPPPPPPPKPPKRIASPGLRTSKGASRISKSKGRAASPDHEKEAPPLRLGSAVDPRSSIVIQHVMQRFQQQVSEKERIARERQQQGPVLVDTATSPRPEVAPPADSAVEPSSDVAIPADMQGGAAVVPRPTPPPPAPTKVHKGVQVTLQEPTPIVPARFGFDDENSEPRTAAERAAREIKGKKNQRVRNVVELSSDMFSMNASLYRPQEMHLSRLHAVKPTHMLAQKAPRPRMTPDGLHMSPDTVKEEVGRYLQTMEAAFKGLKGLDMGVKLKPATHSSEGGVAAAEPEIPRPKKNSERIVELLRNLSGDLPSMPPPQSANDADNSHRTRLSLSPGNPLAAKANPVASTMLAPEGWGGARPLWTDVTFMDKDISTQLIYSSVGSTGFRHFLISFCSEVKKLMQMVTQEDGMSSLHTAAEYVTPTVSRPTSRHGDGWDEENGERITDAHIVRLLCGLYRFMRQTIVQTEWKDAKVPLGVRIHHYQQQRNALHAELAQWNRTSPSGDKTDAALQAEVDHWTSVFASSPQRNNDGALRAMEQTASPLSPSTKLPPLFDAGKKADMEPAVASPKRTNKSLFQGGKLGGSLPVIAPEAQRSLATPIPLSIDAYAVA